jgi:cytochrome c551/c552
MLRAAIYAAVALLAAGLSLVTALVRPSEASTAVPDGAALFHVKGCATCHEGPGTGTMMGIGPSLAHTPDWASTRVEGMSAPDYLAQSMQQPSAFISPAWAGPEGPTTGMPQLQLSDEDVEALVHFLLAPQSATSTVDSTRGSE